MQASIISELESKEREFVVVNETLVLLSLSAVSAERALAAAHGLREKVVVQQCELDRYVAELLVQRSKTAGFEERLRLAENDASNQRRIVEEELVVKRRLEEEVVAAKHQLEDEALDAKRRLEEATSSLKAEFQQQLGTKEETFKSELGIKDEKLASLSASVAANERGLADAVCEISELTNRTEELSIRLREKEQEIAMVTALGRREMELRCQEKDEMIASLKRRLAQPTTAPLVTALASVRRSEEEKQRLEEEMQTMEEKMQRLEEENQRLEEQVAAGSEGGVQDEGGEVQALRAEVAKRAQLEQKLKGAIKQLQVVVAPSRNCSPPLALIFFSHPRTAACTRRVGAQSWSGTSAARMLRSMRWLKLHLLLCRQLVASSMAIRGWPDSCSCTPGQTSDLKTSPIIRGRRSSGWIWVSSAVDSSTVL